MNESNVPAVEAAPAMSAPADAAGRRRNAVAESPELLATIWQALGGGASALDHVTLTGPQAALASPFAVTDLAATSVAAAALAAAEFHAVREGGTIAAVAVDRAHAAISFQSERHLAPEGWELPALWDPVAGDYRCADGWIRLHTNYAHHLTAALAVVRAEPTRDAVARAVATWEADDLEAAVVAAGGCAAAMRPLVAWAAHPQSLAVGAEPLLTIAATPTGTATRPLRDLDHGSDSVADTRSSADPAPAAALPFHGIRVLDLTRVIAGPTATSFLAHLGADVIRVDPPGFAEVPALLPLTTAGKRCVALDLRNDGDRATADSLLARADVVVTGYRADSLDGIGLDAPSLRARHPSLVVAQLDAYGWTGPWHTRRGFDSLVQMSTGIAARGQQLAGRDRPTPLPAQALDYATGYLVAAAIGRALTTRAARGAAWTVQTSLARTARLLVDQGETGDPTCPDPDPDLVRTLSERVETHWGPMRRVRIPGSIAGLEPAPLRPSGPLGRDTPAW